MLPSHSYQGFRTAPIPSGWVQTGERWALWYNGRETASVTPDDGPGVRLWMEGQKMWQVKEVRAASVRQAKRYAERWCAARLCPQLPLRAPVARLVAVAPGAGAVPSQVLTREQRQQARRLAEAGAGEMGRIKEALAPRPRMMAARPEVQGRGGTWSVPGQVPSSPRRNGNTSPARTTPKAPHARSGPLR
ncbi:MAG TPA: hypothetical protein DIC54_05365 [Pseudomonas sp.]|nr:hypothetical protein [Pseudomonas sp.]